jgi:hypothetical protein
VKRGTYGARFLVASFFRVRDVARFRGNLAGEPTNRPWLIDR